MGMRLTDTLGMLLEARQYVTDGEGYVSRQQAFVARLERKGLDSSHAQTHLDILEEMQAEYVSHMERLERQVLMLVRPED